MTDSLLAQMPAGEKPAMMDCAAMMQQHEAMQKHMAEMDAQRSMMQKQMMESRAQALTH